MQTGSLQLLARLGYSARGAVYLLVGGLAVAAAVAGGGGATDSRGALSMLSGDALGIVVLVLIGIGLFGYALWRLAQGLLDADRHGTGAKALAIRGGLIVSGITHTLLGIYALSLVFGSGGGGSGSGGGSEGAAAWIMQQPFGRYLLGAVALGIIGAGLAQVWKGYSGKFREHLKMRPDLERKLSPVCAFGLIARGVVFAIVGVFFGYAALTVDPDQAGGLASALEWIRSQSYGRFLFAVIAFGLLAFGIYGIIEAVWRRINAAEPEHQARQAGAQAKQMAR